MSKVPEGYVVPPLAWECIQLPLYRGPNGDVNALKIGEIKVKVWPEGMNVLLMPEDETYGPHSIYERFDRSSVLLHAGGYIVFYPEKEVFVEADVFEAEYKSVKQTGKK